jgi:hypothetical protein
MKRTTYFIITLTRLLGAAKSTVHIAQIVPQPVWASGNIQESTV